MALKATVHERCQRCGQRAARREGEFVVDWHKCPKAPPGPGDYPRRIHTSQINFVPASWTADELRAEMDAAFEEIAGLRHMVAEHKRRLDDVYAALRGYETTRI